MREVLLLRIRGVVVVVLRLREVPLLLFLLRPSKIQRQKLWQRETEREEKGGRLKKQRVLKALRHKRIIYNLKEKK